jgi:dihydrofolate reductase
MPLNAIVCVNERNGIGYRGGIPWTSSEDMRFFRMTTIGKGNNAIVMGSNTFKSLGYKPLPKRKNYVLTRDPANLIKNTRDKANDIVFETQADNIFLLTFMYDDVFIIGGESIYKMFEMHYHRVYVTYINNHLYCDTFFTVDMSRYHRMSSRLIESHHVSLQFVEYMNNHVKKEEEDGDVEMGKTHHTLSSLS